MIQDAEPEALPAPKYSIAHAQPIDAFISKLRTSGDVEAL